VLTVSRTFHVAIDAIKAINFMKNGGAMDGAFSHSPQTVRDPPKPAVVDQDTAMQDVQQEPTPPPSHKSGHSGGLWSAHRPG
jgi:hypothetical protein